MHCISLRNVTFQRSIKRISDVTLFPRSVRISLNASDRKNSRRFGTREHFVLETWLNFFPFTNHESELSTQASSIRLYQHQNRFKVEKKCKLEHLNANYVSIPLCVLNQDQDVFYAKQEVEVTFQADFISVSSMSVNGFCSQRFLRISITCDSK